MPLAEKYVCASIKALQHKTGKSLGESVRLAMDIGMTCKVSPHAVVTIAKTAARFLNLRPPRVFIKDVCHGHGYSFDDKPSYITIPHSLLHNRPKPYVVYYIAHEVAHTHPNGDGHGSSFKRVERRVLKRFGMGIRYAKAYPRELYALRDGRVLYEKNGMGSAMNGRMSTP